MSGKPDELTKDATGLVPGAYDNVASPRICTEWG